MITAKILADSMAPNGERLTTFILTYPRFIHSEFMTHRAFSRNAASSRAIPLSKMMDNIREKPAWPVYWGTKLAGMASGPEGDDNRAAEFCWRKAGENMLDWAKNLDTVNIHKSIANRLLEPFSHITVIMTSGAPGLKNFFKLRANPAAQPEFQALAYLMLDCWLKSEVQPIPWSGWHIPRFEGEKASEGNGSDTLKIAIGRCARLSYLTHEGDHSVEKDLELYQKLETSGHWSPFEHVARAFDTHPYQHEYDWGNFPEGWMQYRKMYAHERGDSAEGPELEKILEAAPAWVKDRILNRA